MTFQVFYKCNCCGQVFSSEEDVYKENIKDFDPKMVVISSQHNKISIRSTSTYYSPKSLQAPITKLHNCEDNVYGMADFLQMEVLP